MKLLITVLVTVMKMTMTVGFCCGFRDPLMVKRIQHLSWRTITTVTKSDFSIISSTHRIGIDSSSIIRLPRLHSFCTIHSSNNNKGQECVLKQVTSRTRRWLQVNNHKYRYVHIRHSTLDNDIFDSIPVSTSSTMNKNQESNDENDSIGRNKNETLFRPKESNDDDDERTTAKESYYNATNWRTHPELNPLVFFRTWIVPIDTNNKSTIIQSILNSNVTKEYLASRYYELTPFLRQRIRLVRDITIPPSSSSSSMTSNYKYDHVETNVTTTYDEKNDNNEHINNYNSPYLEYKLILLRPDTPPIHELPRPVQNLLLNCYKGDNDDAKDNSMGYSFQEHKTLNITTTSSTATTVQDGPIYPIQFKAEQFTSSYCLEKVLPHSVHPVPVSFETIGHVAHFNLKPHHVPYQTLIGSIILETTSPTIQTVIHKTGDVNGPYRTYPLSVLAGKNDTYVTLTEHNVVVQFDLQDVYWCSRLAEERQRLLSIEIEPTVKAKQKVHKEEEEVWIADAFCGVGTICLLAAKQYKLCKVWCNDWNPKAIEYLNTNAMKNSVSSQFERTQCGDAYDFLVDLGLEGTSAETPPASTISQLNEKKQRQQQRRQYLPDHVIMNYPLEAPKFLSALRWWPVMSTSSRTRRTTSNRGTVRRGNKRVDDEANNSNNSTVGQLPGEQQQQPRVHVYTFARSDESTNRSAEEVAVDIIANNLIPVMPFESSSSSLSSSKSSTTDNDDEEDAVDPSTIHRRNEFNTLYKCNIATHLVRDVAPGKVVVCVSFTATTQLLRHMQGDFL